MHRIFLPAMLAGFLIDCVLGDPVSIPHPVVLIGKAISYFEKRYREEFPKTEEGERKAGLCMNLTVLLLTALLSSALVYISKAISPWLCFAVCTVMSWQIFAAKCLADEAKKVLKALREEGLDAGRKQVGMLVGRDTENLTEEQVVKAAVETVAENASDGVIAPMFWMLLFGPIGGFVYKAVNTMDSMVGYKNDKYINFGRFSAKLDDVFNYIPSRISALAMIGAAYIGGLDGKSAARIWKRDRRNHSSPNSAQTESACAGALGVQLGGNAYYFGKLYEKPTMGDPDRKIEGEDINRACRLMYIASIICLCAFELIGLILFI
jgi:adenosylcobinamide-phosphate synthase